jgi:tRNA (adenine57-N1/adenine58-N1)-methyltransferase catalytic subunit
MQINPVSPEFGVGDKVILTDQKGKEYSITLQLNQEWHTHKGVLKHNDLIGKSQGIVIETNQGLKFTAFKQLLADYVLNMPRGATIIYPKDSAAILGLADIGPGDFVLEAGAGSGALSISLLRAIGLNGFLTSYEKREEFATIAEKNVEKYFGHMPKNWNLKIGTVEDEERERRYTKVVLDMLAPWNCVEMASNVLLAGGVFLCYVATTTQLSQIAEAIKNSGDFTEPISSETIVRGWHHEGLAVRPQHRMIGHTAFLVSARRMAPGVKVPMRRRRPSKGSYGINVDES